MSGVRWTTGIGIVLGGVGGAIAALMGAPAPVQEARATRVPEPTAFSAEAPAPAESSAPASAAPVATDSASAAPVTPTLDSARALPSASVAPTPPPSQLTPPPPSQLTPPPPPQLTPAPALDLPTTREGLLKAELFCDQRRDFDACTRAAQALEQGTTGPADLEQAKRFRRIALTHLVAQCEVDSPHACFVLAAKYRAGTELPSKPASAEALEKRGAELCRLGRSAPECPSP